MAQTLDPMTELFATNINAMADHIDDPEHMVCQIIIDMEGTFSDARKNAAKSINLEKKLEHQLRKAEEDAVRWADCAERCLKKNDKDMAGRALRQKKESEMTAVTLKRKLRSAVDENQELHLEISRMGRELEDIKQKALDLGICRNAA